MDHARPIRMTRISPLGASLSHRCLIGMVSPAGRGKRQRWLAAALEWWPFITEVQAHSVSVVNIAVLLVRVRTGASWPVSRRSCLPARSSATASDQEPSREAQRVALEQTAAFDVPGSEGLGYKAPWKPLWRSSQLVLCRSWFQFACNRLPGRRTARRWWTILMPTGAGGWLQCRLGVQCCLRFQNTTLASRLGLQNTTLASGSLATRGSGSLLRALNRDRGAGHTRLNIAGRPPS